MSDCSCRPEALSKLNDTVFRLEYLIKIYASSQELRPEILSVEVSQSIDVRDLQWLICQFEMGDFSVLPTVEVRDRSTLSGADHRYVTEINTVCLAVDFVEAVSKEDLLTVLLQETIQALRSQ